MLTKDMILSAKDIQVKELKIDEWNGSIYIRKFNGFSREKIENLAMDCNKKNEYSNFRTKVLIEGISDENGFKIFSDDDIKKLSEKNGEVLDRIFKAVMSFNGLT